MLHLAAGLSGVLSARARYRGDDEARVDALMLAVVLRDVVRASVRNGTGSPPGMPNSVTLISSGRRSPSRLRARPGASVKAPTPFGPRSARWIWPSASHPG